MSAESASLVAWITCRRDPNCNGAWCHYMRMHSSKVHGLRYHSIPASKVAPLADAMGDDGPFAVTRHAGRWVLVEAQ